MRIYVTENGGRRSEVSDLRVAQGTPEAPQPGQCWFKVKEGTPLSNGVTQVHALELEHDDGRVEVQPIKINLIIDMSDVTATILPPSSA